MDIAFDPNSQFYGIEAAATPAATDLLDRIDPSLDRSGQVKLIGEIKDAQGINLSSSIQSLEFAGDSKLTKIGMTGVTDVYGLAIENGQLSGCTANIKPDGTGATRIKLDLSKQPLKISRLSIQVLLLESSNHQSPPFHQRRKTYLQPKLKSFYPPLVVGLLLVAYSWWRHSALVLRSLPSLNIGSR